MRVDADQASEACYESTDITSRLRAYRVQKEQCHPRRLDTPNPDAQEQHVWTSDRVWENRQDGS